MSDHLEPVFAALQERIKNSATNVAMLSRGAKGFTDRIAALEAELVAAKQKLGNHESRVEKARKRHEGLTNLYHMAETDPKIKEAVWIQMLLDRKGS